MRSAAVREAWEFYRDTHQGFKEPMRREFRKLDECVDSLESENDKLRELVRDMWAWQDALPLVMRAEIRDRMRELGVVE